VCGSSVPVLSSVALGWSRPVSVPFRGCSKCHPGLRLLLMRSTPSRLRPPVDRCIRMCDCHQSRVSLFVFWQEATQDDAPVIRRLSPRFSASRWRFCRARWSGESEAQDRGPFPLLLKAMLASRAEHPFMASTANCYHCVSRHTVLRHVQILDSKVTSRAELFIL
jgi:hypothetical protein